MQQVRDLGLDRKVFILVGVGPLRSDKAAEYLRKNVPGVVIPDAIVERLREAPKSKKRAVGKQICIEIIQQIKEIKGVAGIHVMAYQQEELVTEIIEEAGLLARPRQPGLSIEDPYQQVRKWTRRKPTPEEKEEE
jgi:methylenetetrahydrofolate reductase (NADPH)